MIKENRYVVLKIKDINAALCMEEISQLRNICDNINDYRANIGKPILLCVVVEDDWPEYRPTWAAIEKRVDSEQH